MLEIINFDIILLESSRVQRSQVLIALYLRLFNEQLVSVARTRAVNTSYLKELILLLKVPE